MVVGAANAVRCSNAVSGRRRLGGCSSDDSKAKDHQGERARPTFWWVVGLGLGLGPYEVRVTRVEQVELVEPKILPWLE